MKTEDEINASHPVLDTCETFLATVWDTRTWGVSSDSNPAESQLWFQYTLYYCVQNTCNTIQVNPINITCELGERRRSGTKVNEDDECMILYCYNMKLMKIVFCCDCQRHAAVRTSQAGEVLECCMGTGSEIKTVVEDLGDK